MIIDSMKQCLLKKYRMRTNYFGIEISHGANENVRNHIKFVNGNMLLTFIFHIINLVYDMKGLCLS